MSEELIQKGLTENGLKVGNYEYYNIGQTTINELVKFSVVPDIDYGDYGLLKPDGLLVDRRNMRNVQVIAVIEYKKPDEFNTKKKRRDAIEQCNTYCEVLNAKFGVTTDGAQFFWINPQIVADQAEYKYIDDYDVERGYDMLIDENGNEIRDIVAFDTEDSTQTFLILCDRIINSIDPTSSQIAEIQHTNPTLLAKQVWQSVWLATGDDPKRCLMTFVELFIFKYLSDLGVLTKNSYGTNVDFDSVYDSGKNYCLKYYLQNVRECVKSKFPADPDNGTTLINGLSLQGQNQDELFYSILTNFKKYGDLKNIDPEFKSRLYEEFLKGTTGKKQLAQFFTPRNVIKAMVAMARVENLPPGSEVCDPASGVGGFILESMIRREALGKTDFYFENSRLMSQINYTGFDYDESTITLAKANLLIFLSGLLKNNPNLTQEFAALFNTVFKLCNDSIIGSLERLNPSKYDLVLSNPPYVTKGLSLYKEYIAKSSTLKQFYTVSSQGKEGLFIEKMIRELKPNGRAFVVVPDGFLYRPSDAELRRFLREQCTLDAIVSLPEKTFYTTTKKTYIIAFTKKEALSVTQEDPVFTYIVSNIGETLDVHRLPSSVNDLENMVIQFNYFMSNRRGFEPQNGRCKIQPIEMFDAEGKWLIDDWWTNEEKVALGIEDEVEEYTSEKIFIKLNELVSSVEEIKDKLRDTFDSQPNDADYFTTTFGNEELFAIHTSCLGLTRKEYSLLDIGPDAGVPIYTATMDPVAYVPPRPNQSPFRASQEQPHISVATDGDGTAGRNIVFHTSNYYLNTSRLSFQILNENIDPMYVFCFIQDIKKKYGFDYRNKCNLTNFKRVEIKIPVDSDGNFDRQRQQEFVESYQQIRALTNEIEERIFEEVDKLKDSVSDHLIEFFENVMNLE